MNRRGRVAFSLAAPFVYDKAQGSDRASYRAVSQKLKRVRGGYALRLLVKRSWLKAPGRQFPVTVDPSVYHIENTGDTRLHHQGANVDCYIKDGTAAGTNQCAGSTQLHLGWDGSTQRRALLRFDVQNALPKGIHILDAELGLYLLSADNASTATVNLHRLTRSWTGGASWNKYDGTNAWTAAGGDFDSSVAASNTVGSTSQWYKWFPRQLVQGWIDGSITNNGVIVKEATERSINNRFFFNSSASTFSQLPYLDVVYEPQTGQRPYYKFQGEQLSDRMDLNVNVARGNLLVHASDVNVSGTGLDLGVERFYNSQLEKQTDFGQGAGWTMGSGAGVRLRFTSSEAIFYAPSGYVVSFQKSGSNFIAPKGIDATLCTVNGTSCLGQSTYALTFNHSQIRNNFDSTGKLVSQRDQNDNQISYAYTSGRLSSITDTQNRVFTVTSNSAGNISQISDPSGRTWQYGYDTSNKLTSYTDPEGKVTTYGYDAGGELNAVTDPRGGSTLITYDGSSEERVSKVERVNDNGPNDVTTYAYSGPTSPCQSSDFGKTVVTDANSHATTYCYDDQGKVGTVFDAKGKKQSTTYSANSFVNTYTSANNSTSGYNTTVDRDSASNSVNSVSQATGSAAADGTLKSSFSYDLPGTASYSPFYPKDSTNTEGNTESYEYDTRGNLKKTTDVSSGTHVDIGYEQNHPGWISSVSDGNGNATTYGYDTVGNRISVNPPTLAANTGTPPGNTTIAYDSLSRPCVVKDGKGQRTAYTYDKLDRVKAIAKYGTSTTFNGCTPGGAAVGSVGLTYDNNGNLTQRVDPNGTSTYTYNALNRLGSQAYPTGRTNTYTYDAVGNLKTLTDAGGTVTYGYDADNLLASVADPGGSCTTTPTTACTKFDVDDDGNRTKTTYPNGVVVTSTYDPAGRLKCVVATNGAPSGACEDATSPLRRSTYNYLNSSGESPTDSALRQSVADQAGNVTAYGYDSLDRLKTATTKNSSSTITDDYTYTYDGAGNMTKRAAKANGGSTTTTTFTYNRANQLCWSGTGTYTGPVCETKPTGVTTYTFDANGNQLTASNGRAYSYNVFDQTISLTPPGGTAQGATYLGPNQDEMTVRGSDGYGNNVLGVGIKDHADSTTSYFTRDGNGALLDERAPGGSKYYYLQDGLGSTIAMTGSTGSVVNSYKYDPYGGIVSSSETTAHPNPFRFAGGLYSSSVGLYKFGMRWYDPAVDRWSQKDPIDQAGDLKDGNPYLYVSGNPINGTDPQGLCVFDSALHNPIYERCGSGGRSRGHNRLFAGKRAADLASARQSACSGALRPDYCTSQSGPEEGEGGFGIPFFDPPTGGGNRAPVPVRPMIPVPAG